VVDGAARWRPTAAAQPSSPSNRDQARRRTVISSAGNASSSSVEDGAGSRPAMEQPW
jgi:hypothetical protein